MKQTPLDKATADGIGIERNTIGIVLVASLASFAASAVTAMIASSFAFDKLPGECAKPVRLFGRKTRG